MYNRLVTVEFSGVVWFWKGPSPFYFVTVPERESAEIKEIASMVTYGWGMIPVTARVGRTEWSTSLWPKDGKYVLPLRDKIRRSEGIQEGHIVKAVLDLVMSNP